MSSPDDDAAYPQVPPSEGPPQEEVDALLDTGHLRDDLGGRSVRSGAVTTVAQALKFGLKLASTVILARLLTPADFGIYGMVAVVTGFVMLLNDMGLAHAVVQRDVVSRGQINTLFWVNLAFSAFLALATAAASPLIAWFYDEPRLVWVTIALAASFVLSAALALHMALLARQMRFVAIGVIDVLSMVVAFAASLWAAIEGWAYWALVVSEVTFFVVRALGAWIATRWVPGMPRRNTGVRQMISFGAGVTGYRIMEYLSRKVDHALIGWYWGASALGFYSRGHSLYLTPLENLINPLRGVAVPVLSRLQDDPARFREFYLNGIKLLSWLTMPAAAVFCATAEEVVYVALGEQWGPTVPIFRLLSLGGFVYPLYSTMSWILVPLGETRRLLRLGAVSSGLLIVSFALALPFGTSAVALAYAASMTVIGVVGFRIAVSETEITPADVLGVLAVPFMVAVGIGLVAWSVSTMVLGDAGPIARVLAAGGMSLVLWVSAVLWSGEWRLIWRYLKPDEG